MKKHEEYYKEAGELHDQASFVLWGEHKCFEEWTIEEIRALKNEFEDSIDHYKKAYQIQQVIIKRLERKNKKKWNTRGVKMNKLQKAEELHTEAFNMNQGDVTDELFYKMHEAYLLLESYIIDIEAEHKKEIESWKRANNVLKTAKAIFKKQLTEKDKEIEIMKCKIKLLEGGK